MWVHVKSFPITLTFFTIRKEFLETSWLASELGKWLAGSLCGPVGKQQGLVIHYLLAAEVAQKKLHLGVVEPLPHIKYIDSVASCQQLLHHVLPQEPRASNHCALLGLRKEGWWRVQVWWKLEAIMSLDSRLMSHCHSRSISLLACLKLFSQVGSFM